MAVMRLTGRRAAATVAALVLVAACSSGDGRGGGLSATSSPGETTEPTLSGAAYEAPAQHASDWAAPPVELPDAPLPYGPSPRPTTDPAFYDVATLDPAEVGAAPPGAVLRSEPLETTGPLDGVSGRRILYRSTTAAGEPAVVSGLVLRPDGSAFPGARPVVAWAHGTTGVADRCAPSSRGDGFYDDYGRVARDLLDQGFVVAATDYHGLGTPGLHSYHHSDELARATIDSVRAAHELDGVGALDPRWMVVGHSEGGLAALAVDARPEWRPEELDYRGAVVAAASANLGEFAPVMFSVPGRGYGVMFLMAAATVDARLDPAVALGPEAAARIPLLTHGCWEEAVPGFDDIDPAAMVAGPEVGERLRDVLVDVAGYDAGEATGPLLVVHGEIDESVPVQVSRDLARSICDAGARVLLRTYPETGHDAVMAASAADGAEWMSARLLGRAPDSSCEPP